MKNLICKCSLLASTLLLSACSGSSVVDPTRTPAAPSSEIEAARETLISYFNELHDGDYASAAIRYGGDLEQLAFWNPDVESTDRGALLKAACIRQLHCLPVRSIIDASRIADDKFEFLIEFSNPDGSLFVREACCGATETEMPPVSQFDCVVEKTGLESYAVMCLPVYIP